MRGVLLRVKDLLGRGGRIGEPAVDGFPATAQLQGRDELGALDGGDRDLRLDDGRDPVERLLRGRVVRSLDDLADLLGCQVLLQPVRHREVGVALHQRLTGKGLVGLVIEAVLHLLEVEVLVLQDMVVLVRVVDLLHRADAALLGDDVQLLLDRVVQAGHLARQEVDVEVGQLVVLRKQPESVVQLLVGGDLVGRVVLAERVLEDLGHLVGRHDGRLDGRLLLQAADRPDLLVDRGVDGRVAPRARRARRGDRGARGR